MLLSARPARGPARPFKRSGCGSRGFPPSFGWPSLPLGWVSLEAVATNTGLADRGPGSGLNRLEGVAFGLFGQEAALFSLSRSLALRFSGSGSAFWLWASLRTTNEQRARYTGWSLEQTRKPLPWPKSRFLRPARLLPPRSCCSAALSLGLSLLVSWQAAVS